VLYYLQQNQVSFLTLICNIDRKSYSFGKSLTPKNCQTEQLIEASTNLPAEILKQEHTKNEIFDVEVVKHEIVPNKPVLNPISQIVQIELPDSEKSSSSKDELGKLSEIAKQSNVFREFNFAEVNDREITVNDSFSRVPEIIICKYLVFTLYYSK
jgi:hypothetical protein